MIYCFVNIIQGDNDGKEVVNKDYIGGYDSFGSWDSFVK